MQDLFSEALDDKIEHLDAIESAHYIYPVDVKSVLTNQDLKTVVCRNFWRKKRIKMKNSFRPKNKDYLDGIDEK